MMKYFLVVCNSGSHANLFNSNMVRKALKIGGIEDVNIVELDPIGEVSTAGRKKYQEKE